MSEPNLSRYRVSFHKTPAMRFTGHLDLCRALERTIRRSGLPLAYSRGFSPHPKLQVAAALPLGFVSRQEVADLWLEQATPEARILEQLQQAAPPGLHFERVESVPHHEPALQQQVRAATYAVALEEPIPPDLPQRVESLLAATSILRNRRGKEYDLRSLITAIRIRERNTLLLSLSAREGATGRPEEVLHALGLDPLGAEIERVALDFGPQPLTAPSG